MTRLGGGQQREFTTGERRAWRLGFLAGVAEGAHQLELFRIKFAGRGVEINAPTHWPIIEHRKVAP